MFAIVEVASRQLKLEKGDVVSIPILCRGKEISLDKVLMTVSGKDINVGTPYLKDIKVVCDVIGKMKGHKVTTVKFRRRKGYHREIGHRDILTSLKVKEIAVKP